MASADDVTSNGKVDVLNHNFYYGRREYEVDINDKEIRWKEGDGIESRIQVDDLLNVKVVQHDNVCTVDLDYITKADKLWKHGKLLLQAEMVEEALEVWRERLNHALSQAKERRPKKLLIIIHPNSGPGKIVQMYEENAAPLFAIAGVDTDVIVTKDEYHSSEVMKTYDLTTIDGLIHVTGDGTLFHTLNAYYKRYAKDNNIDLKEEAADMPELPLTLGIIPAGTINTFAQASVGVRDAVTSTLQIIAGVTHKKNAITLHDGGEFCGLCTNVIWTGLFSQLAKSDDATWMPAPLKKLVLMIKFLWNFGSYSFHAELQYKDENQEWQTKKVNAKILMFLNFKTCGDCSLAKCNVSWMSDKMRVTITSADITRRKAYKSLWAMTGHDEQLAAEDKIEHVDTSECRVVFDKNDERDIDVEAEPINLKSNELYLKFHKDVITAFGQGYKEHEVLIHG